MTIIKKKDYKTSFKKVLKDSDEIKKLIQEAKPKKTRKKKGEVNE